MPVAERLATSLSRNTKRVLTEDQAVAEAERCLSCGLCSECLRCVEACLPKAVTVETHGQLPYSETLNVGAVVVATGFETYDARLSEEFGFGRFPNVVTSLQFERILSASGPTEGHVQRPSDGKEPVKIAWLQCVGSRDQNHAYCSSVCCMYATKEAIIAKEHARGIQPHHLPHGHARLRQGLRRLLRARSEGAWRQSTTAAASAWCARRSARGT